MAGGARRREVANGRRAARRAWYELDVARRSPNASGGERCPAAGARGSRRRSSNCPERRSGAIAGDRRAMLLVAGTGLRRTRGTRRRPLRATRRQGVASRVGSRSGNMNRSRSLPPFARRCRQRRSARASPHLSWRRGEAGEVETARTCSRGDPPVWDRSAALIDRQERSYRLSVERRAPCCFACAAHLQSPTTARRPRDPRSAVFAEICRSAEIATPGLPARPILRGGGLRSPAGDIAVARRTRTLQALRLERGASARSQRRRSARRRQASATRVPLHGRTIAETRPHRDDHPCNYRRSGRAAA
jgi:hypothetical protein